MKQTALRLLVLFGLLIAGTSGVCAADAGNGRLAFSVTLRDIVGADYAFCVAYGRDGRMLAASSLPVTAEEQRVELPCARTETSSVKIITLNAAFSPTGAAQVPDWRESPDSKVMIAYFAVAENSDVDAVSSASVISSGDPRGYPKFVADVIAERTGGTLFSIRTANQYPGVYNTLADYAKNEKESGTVPALASRIDNFDDYDTFFIGYPIWWYTLPQAMVSFFEEYDFSGKTVIPFCTHYGSQSSGTFERIAQFEPNAAVKDGLYLHQNRVTDSESQILSWLDGLGYAETAQVSAVTPGTQTQRGFLNDNVYHSETEGDIHYSSYIPAGYDGSEPYALFITLPGWEGLYFQGVGANMVEDFGTEAIRYNNKMIALSAQLNDWGETSARQVVALTEYFLSHYNIDPGKVYLHGMSGGGETGSLVMGTRPELYAAYFMTASQWDGDLEVLAAARTPVYLAVGAEDSYYGSQSMRRAYETLRGLYRGQGLSDMEIDEILVLNVKNQDYFTERGYRDQHMGGMAFAHDREMMEWMFSKGH